MLNPSLPEPELVSVLLGPLLGDFHYWLSRARSLLEFEEIEFLDTHQQADLLGRVHQTLLEVIAVRSVFKATYGQIGIEANLLEAWHDLVSECWQVMIQLRLGQSN
ncbi:MAG: DUF2605 domain-containing protein [Acaryochloris sp. RU_4_1]|nr:DUF2605 domain-containing protein [Acaryochloridaceae cyanobacterium SU_2_1]NJM64206.1 DUF2605 domain-containing protein [Acaryochloris sp. RU_4_1]NJR53234.1 DUF2605 domain-containing protein [Acaryochloris sp. CRU_2_0]